MTTIGYSMPVDLTIEILLKLPAKTVLRFKSVSKSWCSIINSQQFINAFMSLSLSRPPRIVLALSHKNGLSFFSSPHQICSFSSSSSSMFVTKKCTLSLPKARYHTSYTIRSVLNSVRGFVCCFFYREHCMVCNPTTGQVINLENRGCECMYLGYDPNSDKYKVLRLMSTKPPRLCVEYGVLTLGSSDSWRSIKSNNQYYQGFESHVCIDGVVYYSCLNVQNHRMAIGSFNVGSELLGIIETPQDLVGDDITNYMGKLVVYDSIGDGFNLWVLDDVKNQVWSKKTFVFPIGSKLYNVDLDFMGINACGEVVFSVYTERFFSGSFEFLCYDVEKKVERSVRLEGLFEGLWDVNRSVRFHLYYSLLCSYVDNIIYL